MKVKSNDSIITSAEKLVHHFETADYAVFIFMLIVCSCIGLVFGYKDHMKNNKRGHQRDNEQAALDYLVGGRNLQVVPVAMSLIASGLSGVTLLGMPTETYVYGWSFWFVCIPIVVIGVFTHYVVIPIFYDFHIISVFEVCFIIKCTLN